MFTCEPLNSRDDNEDEQGGGDSDSEDAKSYRMRMIQREFQKRRKVRVHV